MDRFQRSEGKKMPVFAVITNCVLIIFGSILGVLLKDRIPQRFITTLTHCLGLYIVSVGIISAITARSALCVVICLVLGSILGEWIDIEKRLNNCGEFIKRKIIKEENGNSTFVEAFVTASTLFCVGAMSIVGAIEAGANGNPSILLSKAVTDGVTSVSFAATLGIGVAFSSIPLLIYEGGFTLLAILVAGTLPEVLLSEMCAVGGCIVIGIGFNVLNLSKKPLRVANMLPAIFLPLAYYPVADWLSRLFP